MKPKSLPLLAASTFAAVLLIAGLPAAHGDDPAPAAGFKSMFNGKDLTGWDGLEGFWTVKDGVDQRLGNQGASPPRKLF